MLFEDIIGNDLIKKYLRKALEKKTLGNTLLFSGVDGIGKLLLAKALAPFLMCIDPSNIQAIEKIDGEIHPDLHIFRPEGKTSLHSISSIRDLIELVSLAPYEARAKVLIIDEAHRMLPSSFNALLKTLEEPSLDSYIILVTSKEVELLPTIVSRCTRLKFSPLADGEIISLLERWGKTKAESKRIASFALGSVSRALEISSFVEEDDLTKILIDILSKTNVKNYVDLASQLDAIQLIFDNLDKKEDDDQSYRFKAIDILFSQIFMWYRDLYLYKNNISHEHLFFSDKIDLLRKAVTSNNFSLDEINVFLSDAAEAIDRNIKIRTCLERLFLSLKVV